MTLLKSLLWLLLLMGFFFYPSTSIWARSDVIVSNKNFFQEKVRWKNISLAYEIIEVDKKKTSYQVWALTTLTMVPLLLLWQAPHHPRHAYSITIAASTLSIPLGISWALFCIELGKINAYENLTR